MEAAGIDTPVQIFSNPVDALEQIKNEQDIDVLLVDNQMPVMSGLEFFGKYIEKATAKMPVLVLLTATYNRELAAMAKGIHPNIHLLEKPLNADKLKLILP